MLDMDLDKRHSIDNVIAALHKISTMMATKK